MPSYTQYKRQMAVLDADDSEIESWITVRGNHIPIMKGQSKGDAVKSFIEKKKHNLVENHNALIEATKLEEKGYFGKATPSHSKAITKSAIKMGDEEKNLEELMQFGEKEANTAPTRKHYEPDFETVRKNALANGSLYGGKYTQRSKQAAYKEYKNDTSSEENQRAANKWVNSELVAKQSPKNTFLSNPNTLKEFANHFGISESVAKKASEKFGDAFYNVMIKDARAGAGLAINHEDYELADVEKWLKNYESEKKLSKPSDSSGAGKPIHKDLDRMLQSVMAYGGHGMSPEDILASNYHGYFLKDYVNKYGKDTVKNAIKEMQSKIDHIEHDVHTDSEGVSYNSIVWKDSPDHESKNKH